MTVLDNILHNALHRTRLSVALAMYGLLLAILWGYALVGKLLGTITLNADYYLFIAQLLSLAPLLYGLFRSWYFHPVENLSYGKWLQHTPWRFPQPLPLGPARLVWQDVLFLSVVAVTLPAEWPVRAAAPLCMFALGYSLIAWRSAIVLREWQFVYSFPILLGLASPVLLLSPTWPLAAIFFSALAGATLVLSQFSLREGLREFATQDLDAAKSLIPNNNARSTKPAASWPASELLSDRETLWPVHHAMATGGVVAWLMLTSIFSFERWLHAQGLYFEEAQRDYLRFFLVPSLPVVLSLIVIRLGNYCFRYWPPISLLGRLWTGRLIIPGYDVVFVPLVAAALCSSVVPRALLALGAPLSLAVALPAGVGVAIVLGAPPSLTTWRHTGQHRMKSLGKHSAQAKHTST